MKFYLYVGLLLFLVIHWVSATNQTSVEAKTNLNKRVAIIKNLENNLKKWWAKFISNNENQDTFTGKVLLELF